MATPRNSLYWNSAVHGLLFTLAALALTSLGCSLPNVAGRVDPVIQGPWTAEIGPEGGRVSAPSLQLEVPAGALAGSTVIQVDIAESDNPADLSAFDLGPDGLTFQMPATVSVSYGGVLPADASPASLQLVHTSEAGEFPLADQVIDTDTERISGSLDHFSQVVLRLEEMAVGPTGLAGSEQKIVEEQDFHAEYHISLLYEPAANTWELFVVVEQERSRGFYYELFSEGNIKVPHSGDLLTEGTVMLHGECLFEYGGQASRSSFQGVAAPFQILSEAAPGEGDTVRVIINPESLELNAFEDDDALGEEGGGLACPAFGPREAFELTLEEALPVVPLD